VNSPSVVVLAGPNGAGKSTAAPELLKDTLAVTEFVNADVIARGLSAFDPERAALAAGRVMRKRLQELARERKDFAFETTLASRSFAPWLAELADGGYDVYLIFLWLPSAHFAVARVAERVRRGGHGIPEETIRRRYRAGLRNFWELYQPLATTWQFYDNSFVPGMRLIAAGGAKLVTWVADESLWQRVQKARV
jgi:predicted ABC-type ATPase